ncbi:tRNA1(Val) (adenine(37)-N6)-methyltransferase [Chryseobacterium hagamense]|uniref:tRNA1(Val) (adenine(37)-N6)-methyltransferase n=1 Tax=Chryseobacterium hagamense TaxID=395935 RepID=A0A511YNP5_9FLAO|nr:methyltransferase [Chryseobacterium hagamense]GEN76815.1 tRNA1(Val) (adenine(37)-N6)-methyltransferase [Chryseobacterium hagamense]
MKPFIFRQFEIRQSEEVFRVGTDGVLLGASATVSHASKVLEVGTGTGLISLMLAQRNLKAKFLGIDINEEAVELTRLNFENSPFASRLNTICKDFKSFNIPEKFDLIVSNPPYFEASDSEKDKIARQTVELNFLQLISKSAKFLSEEGILSVIIPAEAGKGFIETAKEHGLVLIRKINIKGIETANIKRLILEFSLSEQSLSESEFIIEKSPRKYSDPYLELTKEFHVFRK